MTIPVKWFVVRYSISLLKCLDQYTLDHKRRSHRLLDSLGFMLGLLMG